MSLSYAVRAGCGIRLHSFQVTRLENKSCSTQLSIKIFLLINVKMPTVFGILTFMSRKKSVIGLSEPEKAECLYIFYNYEHLKFHAQLG